MIFRLFMIVFLIIAGFYLLITRLPTAKTPPKPTEAAEKPVLPPPPPPLLDEAQLKRIHQISRDPDPNVRWAAIELMFRLHDPAVLSALEESLTEDVEPTIRKKALALLKEAAKKGVDPKEAINKLNMALKDPDREMRIAGLLALGEIGDSSVVKPVTEVLTDTDSDVRVQALHTLTQLQSSREAAYEKLKLEIKEQMERKNDPYYQREGIRWN